MAGWRKSEGVDRGGEGVKSCVLWFFVRGGEKKGEELLTGGERMGTLLVGDHQRCLLICVCVCTLLMRGAFHLASLYIFLLLRFWKIVFPPECVLIFLYFVVSGFCKSQSIRFIYFQFTELKVCESNRKTEHKMRTTNSKKKKKCGGDCTTVATQPRQLHYPNNFSKKKKKKKPEPWHSLAFI